MLSTLGGYAKWWQICFLETKGMIQWLNSVPKCPVHYWGGGGCWCVHTSSYRGSECTRSAECTLIIPKPANLQSAPNTSPVIWLGYHGNLPIIVHIICVCCLHLGCTTAPTNRVHRAYFAGRLWRHLLQYLGSSRPKQTRDVDPMLFQCWADVEYGGPTLIKTVKQHWFNILFLFRNGAWCGLHEVSLSNICIVLKKPQ